MTTLFTSIKNKKNLLSKSFNPNKSQNFYIKKGDITKTGEFISRNNELDKIDKVSFKKISLIQNTSNKKLKQKNKISIMDFDNNSSLIQNNISQNSKILFTRNNLSSNYKKNINNELYREKNNLNKLIENNGKVLKNIVTEVKIKTKNRNLNLKRKIKNKNNCSINLNDSNITLLDIEINKKNEELLNKKLNNNKIYKIKNYQKNNILTKSDNDFLKSFFLKDKQNLSKEELSKDNSRNINKNILDKKIIYEKISNSGKIDIYAKKLNINKSTKNKSNNNIIGKKKYNDKEIDKNKNLINIINNFDIINIINIKEKAKKLSTSIRKNKKHNETNILKQKRKIMKNYGIKVRNVIKSNKQTNKNIEYLNYINLIKKSKNKDNEIYICGLNTPKSNKQNNYIENNTTISYTEKNNNKCISVFSNDINQNKWDKKCFVPVVSASLVNGESFYDNINKSDRKSNNENDEKFNNNINQVENNNIIYNTNYNSINSVKSINKSNNFFDNNIKKKEILFNFIHKKLKVGFDYLNLNSKRTKSFIFRRNKHITERNNSLNQLKNNYSNIDFQEKELDEIHNEINQNKLHNIYTISVDNIYNYNFHKNEDKRKEYKRIYIKINSMNNFKKDNNILGNIIIKRGELLNKLRNIKRNYSSLEKDKKL